MVITSVIKVRVLSPQHPLQMTKPMWKCGQPTPRDHVELKNPAEDNTIVM